MKAISFITGILMLVFGTPIVAQVTGLSNGEAFAMLGAFSIVPLKMSGAITMASTPDLTAISAGFYKYGGDMLFKNVNEWAIRKFGFKIITNLKAPQVLPRLKAKGSPKPYKEASETAGNGVAVTDRTITAYQSKWDYDINPENLRNTYLSELPDATFIKWAAQQVAAEYLAALNDSTVYLGERDADGTDAAAICDGFAKIIADAIISGDLVPVATGAVSSSNAVAKVQSVAKSVPAWMRAKQTKTFVSYDVFDKYAENFAATYGYQFNPDATNSYRINNTNSVLIPLSMMGTSQRIITTLDNNLTVGTDGEAIVFANSVDRDIIKARPKMPLGTQIADFEAMAVNDQE